MNARNIALAVLFVLGLALTIWAHRALGAASKPVPVPKDPHRVVTLAPSVTETVFAVGLGPSVVGVTRFCHYPPQVEELPKIGGFSDINVEAIVRLRPDLAIMPVDKVESQRELTRLAIPVMTMDTRTLGGLLDALKELGAATGHRADADQVIARLGFAMGVAERRAAGKPKPKVMFSVMHSYSGPGEISELTIAGKDGFFDHLIDICGGVNAYQGRIAFPTVSREAISLMDPDVIIDLMRSYDDGADSLPGWMKLTSVSAVRENRVYMFTVEADTVPGPRAWKTILKVSMVLHPEPGYPPPNILGDLDMADDGPLPPGLGGPGMGSVPGPDAKPAAGPAAGPAASGTPGGQRPAGALAELGGGR
jgi:iron complex transport system substrate-binding protein